MKQITRFYSVSALDLFKTYSNDVKTSPLYTLYALTERGLPAADGMGDYLLQETLQPAMDTNYKNMTYQTGSRALVLVVTCDQVEVEFLLNTSEYGAAGRQGWGLDMLDDSVWTCSREHLNRNWIMTMSA